jgi:hypothetical protein
MKRCTCLVFAKSGELHNHDCPRRQAYKPQDIDYLGEQLKREEARKTRKDGKKARMAKLVNECASGNDGLR